MRRHAIAAGAVIGLIVAILSAEDATPAPPPEPVTARAAACQSRACWRRVHQRRARRVCVRRHGRRACAFRAVYRELDAGRRSYIDALFGCEAGRLPWDADGSGFRYRGEWTAGTWANAGGAPVAAPSYWEEAVRVSRWLDVVGHHSTRGWPNCPR